MQDYPEPNAPMMGPYLARRKRSAFVFRAIDVACKLLPKRSSLAGGAPTSILVSQGGHLGDLIMTLPMLHWLREHRPNVRIGLLVGTWSKPMLESIRGLYDDVYFADHFMLNRSAIPRADKLRRHAETWRKAIADIRAAKYDMAIEAFQFFPNNIPLLWAAGVPRRVGYTSGSWSNLLTDKVAWVHMKRHVCDYPRDLLRAIFDDRDLAKPFLAYYPPPAREIAPVDGEYVVVHMGTGNEIREWDEARWSMLVASLLARGERVVLAGAGRAEGERAGRIAAQNPGALDLSNKLSWDAFVALMAYAKHAICLESSSAHVAAAFDVPTSVIMPGINMPQQLGPYTRNAVFVTRPTPCAPCYRTLGCEAMTCIRSVTVEDAERAFQMKRPIPSRMSAASSM